MMRNPLPPLLLVVSFALIFFLLWALSIASVVWDARRRHRSDLERYGWVAFALLFPLVGGLGYWTVRLMTRYLQTVPSQAGSDSQRYTQMMAVAAPEAVHSTILARDPAKVSPSPAPSPDEISTQDPPRKGGWRLTIIAGAEQGRQFPLTSLPQMIGRSNAAGILLGGDAMISRQHAEIYDRQGLLSIRDMGSLHGTQVNGVPIQDRNLEPGDRIQVGGTVLLVQTSEDKR